MLYLILFISTARVPLLNEIIPYIYLISLKTIQYDNFVGILNCGIRKML